MKKQGLPGWAVPAGTAVLVVGLVALALARGPAQLDPDSPEGTVQQYLTALNEERWDDAIEVLHPSWSEGCDGESIAASHPGPFSAELGQNPSGFGGGVITETFERAREIGVDAPQVLGETTTVEVTITHNDSGGLGGGGWDEYVLFELMEEDGFWWLVGDPWPYFTWNCRGR